jgi:hypothetical protein
MSMLPHTQFDELCCSGMAIYLCVRRKENLLSRSVSLRWQQLNHCQNRPLDEPATPLAAQKSSHFPPYAHHRPIQIP